MKKEAFDIYAELEDGEGVKTLFRKFETGTWILQFKEEKCIGQAYVSNENIKTIHNAPTLKMGDGTSKQLIK